MTKVDLRKKIAEQNGVSARTLKRYEKRYQEGGLKGLAPDPRSSHGPSPLPENFDTLLKESIELRRELPDRSVDCIIRILECEERIPPGVLKRPTLQRHMYDAGFGQEHMKQYLQARESSPKRYCMPHRMMMLQADIKESGGFHVMVNGKSQEIYLSTVIDDHSRFILWSKFYENETAWIVEDSFRGAFLKYGRPKKVYCDRGSQYINKQLRKACAELMIRISYAPRKSGKSKGVVLCEGFFYPKKTSRVPETRRSARSLFG